MRATVRCYAELNDFLPRARRQVAFEHAWDGRVSVKDLLEGLGVPHGEVDLLLVNGESSGFDRLVEDGDRVAAYPVFESFDIASETKVRPGRCAKPGSSWTCTWDGLPPSAARRLRRALSPRSR